MQKRAPYPANNMPMPAPGPYGQPPMPTGRSGSGGAYSPADAAAAAAAAAYSNYYGFYLQQQQQQQQGGQGQQQQQGAQPEELKVSQTSVPQSVAGKIAADARAGVLTPLVARGKQAINTTTKAIAIACSYLVADGISLACSPYHKNDGDETTGRSVVFYLKKRSMQTATRPTTILKVTKTTVVAKVAGGIASKIRQGEVIAMQGIGPDAVQHAIDSFVVARRFLKADSALDITFTPQFITVPVGERTASALYFTIEAFSRT